MAFLDLEAKLPRPANFPDAACAGLLRRVTDGDRQALAAFYDVTSPSVFGLVLRIVRDQSTAEDVTTEVYLQVWRGSVRFAGGAGAVNWLLGVAQRRAVDRLRARRR
jgi:RNA polymerase sigma-70 factor, ECF subfamily